MIGAAIRKDVWLLVRDRGAVISLFVLPIAFIVAFGFMFGASDGRGEPRPIALWHAPGDPRGAAIARALADTPGFAPRPLPSAEAVRAEVAREAAIAGLVVPPDPAHPVELAIDLGGPVAVRGPIQAALTGAVVGALAPPQPAKQPPLVDPTGRCPAPRAEPARSPPRDSRSLVEARTPPGIRTPLRDVSSFQLTVPGNAVLFGFFIALTVAMAFAGERRTGTWRRLLAAPVPRWKALVATLVPYAIVGACQLAFLFSIGALAFGMQIAGSPAALGVLSLAVVYAAVCLGLLMASIGGSEKQLGGIGSVVLLVMGMLGGCMYPRLLMPAFMQKLGLGVPHGWALDGYYAVLVRQDTTIADIAPELTALLGFGTGFALLGILLFRFER